MISFKKFRVLNGVRRIFTRGSIEYKIYQKMVPDTNRRKLSAVVGAIDTDAYETQLTEKQQGIRERFAKFNPPTLEVFRSRPEHYRMR